MNIFLWFLSTPFITARISSQHPTYSWGFDSQPGRVSRYKCVCVGDCGIFSLIGDR